MNILATLDDTELLDEKGSFKQFDQYRIINQYFVCIRKVYVDGKLNFFCFLFIVGESVHI